VNPGLYKPSPKSHNLHETGQLQYLTTDANGCGFANISYSTFTDTVNFAGLTAHNQTFAEVKKTRPPNAGTITQFRHPGLAGFAGTKADQTQLGGVPFFQTLCNQGVVNECRFGLAFGISGMGKQILGGVDKTLFTSELSEAPFESKKSNLVHGSIVYQNSKEEQATLKDQFFVFDSGTSNIVGPNAAVRQLFKDIGVQIVKQTPENCTSVVLGYYPCDSPAKVGFKVGKENFYIEPSAFKLADNGKNNCTATITAIAENLPFWVVGQSVS
jgi:hypothetical protein